MLLVLRKRLTARTRDLRVEARLPAPRSCKLLGCEASKGEGRGWGGEEDGRGRRGRGEGRGGEGRERGVGWSKGAGVGVGVVCRSGVCVCGEERRRAGGEEKEGRWVGGWVWVGGWEEGKVPLKCSICLLTYLCESGVPSFVSRANGMEQRGSPNRARADLTERDGGDAGNVGWKALRNAVRRALLCAQCRYRGDAIALASIGKIAHKEMVKSLHVSLGSQNCKDGEIGFLPKAGKT